MDSLRDTIEGIRNAMAKAAALGPTPFFASHSLLQTDSAIRFEYEGRAHFAAHPLMWAKVPVAEMEPDPLKSTISRPFFGIAISGYSDLSVETAAACATPISD